MALFHECMPWCAQNELDTADIVREAMFRQRSATARLTVFELVGSFLASQRVLQHQRTCSAHKKKGSPIRAAFILVMGIPLRYGL